MIKTADQVRIDAKQNDITYKQAFNSIYGHAVLTDLKARFGDKTCVALKDGVVDVNRTLINEGAREVVLYILARIKKGEDNVGMDE